MPYVSKQFLVLGEYIIRSIIVLVLYVALIAIKIPCNIKIAGGAWTYFTSIFLISHIKKFPLAEWQGGNFFMERCPQNDRKRHMQYRDVLWTKQEHGGESDEQLSCMC